MSREIFRLRNALHRTKTGDFLSSPEGLWETKASGELPDGTAAILIERETLDSKVGIILEIKPGGNPNEIERI